MFSRSMNSGERRNSSISVKGRGGAVDALMGITLGNSNSSSEVYYPFFPLLPGISLKKL